MIQFEWMQVYQIIGQKMNSNIISLLICFNGLDEMAHWTDYIEEQVS